MGVNIKSYTRIFTGIAIALIIIDVITTLYGFSFGFEEKNIIARQFIVAFGDFGIIIAAIAKIGLLALMYAVYLKTIQSARLTGNKTRIYEICYAVTAIAAGFSALNSSINNLYVFGSLFL